MKIQPINHYTIIRLDKQDDRIGKNRILHAAGTILEKYDLPKRSGTVKAVGRGLVTAAGVIVPPQVQPGDRVWLLDLSSAGKPFMEFEYEGEKCVILPGEEMILGIITEEEPVKSALEA